MNLVIKLIALRQSHTCGFSQVTTDRGLENA